MEAGLTLSFSFPSFSFISALSSLTVAREPGEGCSQVWVWVKRPCSQTGAVVDGESLGVWLGVVWANARRITELFIQPAIFELVADVTTCGFRVGAAWAKDITCAFELARSEVGLPVNPPLLCVIVV